MLADDDEDLWPLVVWQSLVVVVLVSAADEATAVDILVRIII